MAQRTLYKTADGQRVPGVTTITSRFENSRGLIHWANRAGLDGKTLEEARVPAASAGTMAHELVEAHVNGRPLPELTGDPDVIAKARAAFSTYLKWQEQTALEVRHSEVSLVSEVHRFGGRLDAIGRTPDGLVLVDWKTSGSVYGEYLLQLAAYGLLWNENYRDHQLCGYHLCRFAKEEGDFAHHYFPSLNFEADTFLMLRDLYDRMKKIDKRVK